MPPKTTFPEEDKGMLVEQWHTKHHHGDRIRGYPKIPKFLDIRKLYCNLPNIKKRGQTLGISSKRCKRIANREDPDQTRVGTSIVQPVDSRGKCRKLPARQILQKSLRWQILAFMNKIKLKACRIKTYYLILQKNGINHLLK